MPWVRDVVPALGGLALHFDPDHAEFPAKPLDEAFALVTDCMKSALAAKDNPGSEVELPVCYEPEFALDLEEVAKKAGAVAEEVASRHAAAEYRVLMVGFAPGHAYMGGLDPKLAVPRRASPRARGAGGLGGDRQRADGGLSVRDLGRLERHRPHADDAVRRRAPAAEPAVARRPRALPRDHARGIHRNAARQ